MDRPPLGSRTVAWPLPDSTAAKIRSAFGCRLVAGFVSFAGFARGRADATVAGAGLGWFGRKVAEAERWMTTQNIVRMAR